MMLRLNRLHRLLLFGSAVVWLLAAVLSVQRNYEDSWILDGVIWPYAGFVALTLILLWIEKDNRWVAILCSLAVTTLLLIPGLKYVQAYGQATDQVMHYQMVNSLITTGYVSPQQAIYQAIAGMHSWLASMGITSGLTASQVIKIGFPLAGGILPLLVYWICHRIMIPKDITKYVIILSCLATFPYHTVTGTGFTLIPLVLFLSLLIIREYFSPSATERIVYTLLILIVLVQLTIWHSTTPFMVLVILVSISFTPVLVWFATGRKTKININIRFLEMGLLATIFILGYHTVEFDPVFKIVFSHLYDLVVAEYSPSAIVPASTFQLSSTDVVKVFLLTYGREGILLSLAGVGFIVAWFQRNRLENLLNFYAYLSMIFVPFVFAVSLSLIGIDFKRLIWIPVTFSPFFAGYALWWWIQKMRRMGNISLWFYRAAGYLFIILVVVVFSVQFYSYQPLVPTTKSEIPGAPDEYALWIHQVNTAYQQRMISFAETYSDPETRFDVDLVGNRQYIRYYGKVGNRGLYLPLIPKMGWLDYRDDEREKLFLLHWPGAAGGLGEQIQYRSVKNLTQLRNTIGWELIYDNGESFILQIPGSYQ